MLMLLLMAEATAILSFLIFTNLTAIKSKYQKDVLYSNQLRTIRRNFTAIVCLLFHQLSFMIWQIPLFGLMANTPMRIGIAKVGTVCLIIGAIIYRWSIAIMSKYVLPPMSVAPTGEAVLVKDGPYQFSRNPMYVSYWLMFTGVQLLTLSPLILLSPVIATTFQGWVLQEEIDQLKLHGEHYAKYISTTPRWFSLSKCLKEICRSLYLH